MSRQIPQKLIIEGVLDGIDDAENAYERWSGGEWLAYSAEHLISGFVARSIMEAPGSKFITIEQNCKAAIKAACGERRGRLAQATRPAGRIDILLWWAQDSPRAAIEIKHNVYNYEGQCGADINRIAKLLLMRETTLQFGLFVFYSSADDGRIKTAEDKLETRYRSILSRAQSAWGKSLRVEGTKRVHRYGNGAWASACIVLKPHRGSSR
jgi:hypothetical protein